MRLLLEGKCEANVVDALGNTPLHYAAQRGTHGVLTGYSRGTHGVLEATHTTHIYAYVRATCEHECADICAYVRMRRV